MKAEVLTIGDELLRGEIVDSNKSFLSDRLLGLDVETYFHTSVRDEPDDMRDAFVRAIDRSDVVLVSGGLGPTRDDLTTEVLAETVGRKLFLDKGALEALRAFFANVGREMAQNNEKQAWFPEGADVLENPVGTAPGFMIEERGTLVFCMPGVPRELYKMMDEQVLPRVARKLGGVASGQGSGLVVRATLLRTFGMGESTLDAELADIANEGDVTLGFRTAFPDNYLRPLARAATAKEAEAKLAGVCDAIRERLGALVYGENDDTLAVVVGRELAKQGKALATAESCTGGLIAEQLTDVPGSSEYFCGGVVAYANEAKTALLGVDAKLLAEHGAVSEPVACAMAQGVCERFGSDIGIATTGISGPGGGSDEKPVGLVYIALHRVGGETHCEKFVFPLDRSRHRQLTAHTALDWVRRSLLGVELVGPGLMRRQDSASTPGGGGAKRG
jgi:nicotinamide-nucleotide amidase